MSILTVKSEKFENSHGDVIEKKNNSTGIIVFAVIIIAVAIFIYINYLNNKDNE